MAVYRSSGDSRGPMLSGEQWQARERRGDFAHGDSGYYAHQAYLAANPLKPTRIVLESQARECRNKASGGRTGYDW